MASSALFAVSAHRCSDGNANIVNAANAMPCDLEQFQGFAGARFTRGPRPHAPAGALAGAVPSS